MISAFAAAGDRTAVGRVVISKYRKKYRDVKQLDALFRGNSTN